MINNKQELIDYMNKDAIALARKYKKPRFIHDNMWKYQILMRKCEYYENCKHSYISKVYLKILKMRYTILGQFLGYSIPLNVFGPGLAIAHYGSIVVNAHAKIGKNCRIHEGTTIGADGLDSEKAPIIGDNVYIATGAKIIGNIKIANNVVIGANAVVVKDILEEGTTWAGVPAKKISDNNSDKYIKKA